MAPSELKKLRNKQRKARRKAEQESAQAREAQVKRDQHHKSKQQTDVEIDAPQLDELIPDKLARVSMISKKYNFYLSVPSFACFVYHIFVNKPSHIKHEYYISGKIRVFKMADPLWRTAPEPIHIKFQN